MEKNILTRMGALNCQVCSSESIEEALIWLQSTHPAGTEHNWQIDERECVKPVQCADYPDRKHYIFIC